MSFSISLCGGGESSVGRRIALSIFPVLGSVLRYPIVTVSPMLGGLWYCPSVQWTFNLLPSSVRTIICLISPTVCNDSMMHDKGFSSLRMRSHLCPFSWVSSRTNTNSSCTAYCKGEPIYITFTIHTLFITWSKSSVDVQSVYCASGQMPRQICFNSCSRSENDNSFTLSRKSHALKVMQFQSCSLEELARRPMAEIDFPGEHNSPSRGLCYISITNLMWYNLLWNFR